MPFDKASPLLQEKSLLGEIIPKLEIEQTNSTGRSRATYLQYKLTNVQVTSFQINTSSEGQGGGRPIVTLTNAFEEIKVTYTEFDNEGSSQGNTEYTWIVEAAGV